MPVSCTARSVREKSKYKRTTRRPTCKSVAAMKTPEFNPSVDLTLLPTADWGHCREPAEWKYENTFNAMKSFNFTPVVDFSAIKEKCNCEPMDTDSSENKQENGFNLFSGGTSQSSLVHGVLSKDVTILENCIAAARSQDNYIEKAGQALHVAVSLRNLKLVELLLKNSADPNFCKYGPAPIIQSVDHELWDIMNLLLKHGADINATRGDGTVLHITARKGKVQKLKELIQLGGDVNSCAGSQDISPLCAATQANRLECAELLLNNGARTGVVDKSFLRTPLHWAAMKGNVRLVELLLANGADTESVDRFGFTPFMYSVTHNQSFVTARLITREKDINRKSSNGKTALHFAAETGSATSARHLLAAGANPNLKDDDGKTPLILAAEHSKVQVVKLLANKCCPKETDEAGYTAFQRALEKETFNPVPCEILLRAGADINAPFPSGIPVLSRYSVDPRRVHWLLSHGADPNVYNRGCQPLWEAARAGNVQCVQLYIKANADMNARGKASENSDQATSPVQEALSSMSVPCVKSLVLAGCDLSGLQEIMKNIKTTAAENGEIIDDSLKECLNWVEVRLRTPRTLQEWARVGARKGLGLLPRKTIQEMPLPSLIKSFLVIDELKYIDRTCLLTL